MCQKFCTRLTINVKWGVETHVDIQHNWKYSLVINNKHCIIEIQSINQNLHIILGNLKYKWTLKNSER